METTEDQRPPTQAAQFDMSMRQWLLVRGAIDASPEIDAEGADDLFATQIREKINVAIVHLRCTARGHTLHPDVGEVPGRIFRISESDSQMTMGYIRRSAKGVVDGRKTFDLLWNHNPNSDEMMIVATTWYPEILMALAQHLGPEGACDHCGYDEGTHNPGCVNHEAD